MGQPNFQNIPIRTDAGRRIREALMAASMAAVDDVDCEQIELRILAYDFLRSTKQYASAAAAANAAPSARRTSDG